MTYLPRKSIKTVSTIATRISAKLGVEKNVSLHSVAAILLGVISVKEAGANAAA